MTRVRLIAETRESGELYPAGSTGTIVHVYDDGRAFEVEISHPTRGVVTIEAGALEALSP